MARTLSVPQQTFQPGTYGPYSIDSFTKNNTDYLEVAMTIVNWPVSTDVPVPPLFDLQIKWDTGEYASFALVQVPRVDKYGNPEMSALFRSQVPRDATGKRSVSGGNATLTVYAAFTSAVTVHAV